MLSTLSALHADALRELPPAAAALRSLSPLLGLLLAALGSLLLVAGGRRRRPVAAAGGMAVGAIAGLLLARATASSLGVEPQVWAMLCGGAAAVLGAALPSAVPFLAGAAVGGVVGRRVPLGGLPELGMALGAVVSGAVALLAARAIVAALVGLLGGVLAVAGAIALSRWIPGAGLLATHPLVALGVALVLGVAGAVRYGTSVEQPDPSRRPRPAAPPRGSDA